MANPGFICWASARLEGVQTLRMACSAPKLTQADICSGLCHILAHTPQLQRLHVPHSVSLPPAVLAKLPPSLVDATLSVAFDDSCLLDTAVALGQAYAFPCSMPQLRTLDLQARPSSLLILIMPLIAHAVPDQLSG